ncbi:aspartate--tRNA ligase [Blattabacterium cuenoti]|uniref:aspartate--tRNA ligase n=1 Tax=Blattabacterium cuenoti TaxID=1653831 RepID=UPI00163BAA9A|nr:aspartate--tRNA ligase [Blattabacterium cuenoti]
MYRTHNCGELCKKDIGKEVILSGWIQNIRDLGSLFFIDIRDYFGITQLIFTKKKKNIFLEKEFLIKIKGKVIERLSKNYKIPTGEIEILVFSIEILNSSISIPFSIENEKDGTEKVRMMYRYLDIRRNTIKNNLIIRHDLTLEIRNFLSRNGFLEIETPILTNYTSEGARSFVVPSRTQIGKFYALSQSPQLFKQLLMIGGIDKYFQIVKCFRDEDPRSDRQIEFTQIDCEMSFVEKNDILIFFENFIKHLFNKIKNIQLEPFPSISYTNAIKMYGTDKPDLRLDMSFVELNHLVKDINFLKDQELVIGIKVKEFVHVNDFLIKLKKVENKNFLWIHIQNNKEEKNYISSNQDFSKENLLLFIKYFKASPGDLLFIYFGNKKETREKLRKIRFKIAHHLNLINPKLFKPLWIIDSPLFEWEEKYKRYKSVHHPFTSPKEEDIHLLLEEKDPGTIRSQSFDLIINGIEIGSGSIRIHNKNVQNLVFKHLGLSIKEIESQFGFFIKALEYGTPPHGGIAFGLDRLINLLEGNDNIKNFIAFPKNNYGKDLMINAPSFLKDEKLNKLHF